MVSLRRSTLIASALVLTFWTAGKFVAAPEAVPLPVEFNRDIRPILSNNCFQCHGPDQKKRKANLRLDTEDGMLAKRGDSKAVIPGQPGQSELFKRITAKKVKERMPPVSSGHKLTPQQIELLRRWIEQGAKWQKHWSLIAPKRPDFPSLLATSPKEGGKGWKTWVRNGIDAFILARLEREGLTPNPEADRTTLIRRVTLDLTGLPPTPAEVDAFLKDQSPGAYEKVVDRLLASPRYGERMAARWLEAARYADTNGYQGDGERIMWRWRDWVIDAFNRNMPFDQFTVEQIAGDLLPGSTLQQKIATGFNRNHRGNAEGGIIPEEYAVEYVVDRVDTTATVWLGLTMGCARCHDHKYDPISQKEFYQVFAYFNNVPERGKVIRFGNSPPVVRAPTREQQEQLRALETKLQTAEKGLASLEKELTEAQRKWEKTVPKKPLITWSRPEGLLVHFPLDGHTANTANGEGKPSQSSTTAKFQDGTAAYVPGRSGKAVSFDGKRFLDAGDLADFSFYDRFSFGAWIYPNGTKGGTILSRMADNDRGEGFSLYLQEGKLRVSLSKRWLDDAMHLETQETLPPGQWVHVFATYDGSRTAMGLKLYVNGQPRKAKVHLDDLNQDFKTPEPLRIGWGGGPLDRFHGSIADVRIYDDCLAPEDVELIATTETINDILALPAAKRSKAQAYKVRAYFLARHAPKHLQQAHREVITLRRERERFIESIPTVMVMEEMKPPRDTYLLIRGEYDKKGVKVTRGVPASLPPLPKGAPNNRLGLARWLVDPSNPLTARVAVNRFWQMYFGAGLVKTVEDFGSQGEWPSHPELLDWLATEFIRTGWDIKATQKLIVTSATYRQSSKVTPALFQKDPDNRLLVRGPRFRLSAEMIRDQALAVSGLLVEKVGGPSVKPYQPKGLIKELHGTGKYRQDHGANLYRRSVYTFWKRTVAPPAMITFDAAMRESCVVRETRTNTPLQALNLLNDVTFVEAARVLAQRVMVEGGTTPEERITLAFQLAAARQPRPLELKILRAGFDEHLAEYREDGKAALKLVSVGEYPRNEKLDVSELAAYTAVASLIFNLDEVITKE
jgi:hypothetical protein